MYSRAFKYSGASWAPKNKGFYYTYLPKGDAISVAERPGHARIRYHALGTSQQKDKEIFPRTGSAKTFTAASVSRDGRWLIVAIYHGWAATDVYFKDLRNKTRAPKKKLPYPTEEELADLKAVRANIKTRALAWGFMPLRVGEDASYLVEVWDNKFYVMTDEGAPKYHAFVVGPKKPQRDKWVKIVPESDATLSEMSVLGGKLALSYLRNVTTELEIRTLRGELVRKVKLPGLGSAALRGDPAQDEAYYSYQAFTTLDQIYSYRISDGATSLWDQLKIPVDTRAFKVEQKWYASKDGTKIPMFIISNKKFDGPQPTVLYGYGGFTVSLTPRFNESAVAWVERGGTWAIANLRGGGEFGEAWHRAGMKTKKQNVFDDYIAAAEYLHQNGYSTPKQLAIYGGSNGGLLVGAAMTQRPELFGAVICAVPLLDMVRYHEFGSGRTWIPEYGSAADETEFRAIYAYSPYHHVKEGTDYPALLMMAADSDDRVDPMHARKFTAAIQWASIGRRPTLMRVEKNAGHGGADMVAKNVERYADQYAFLWSQLGKPIYPFSDSTGPHSLLRPKSTN